jgi:hypothetical protein
MLADPIDLEIPNDVHELVREHVWFCTVRGSTHPLLRPRPRLHLLMTPPVSPHVATAQFQHDGV